MSTKKNTLTVPAAGENISYAVQAGEQINMGFAPETVELDFGKNGNDLIIEFDNGGSITLTDFFNFLANSEDAPTISLPESDILSSADFINLFLPDLAAADSIRSGGLNAYSDNTGALLSGIDSLNAQDTISWQNNSAENPNDLTHGFMANASVRTPAFPGGDEGTPPEHPTNTPTIDFAWAGDIITGPSGAETFVLDGNGTATGSFSLNDFVTTDNATLSIANIPQGWTLSAETITLLKSLGVVDPQIDSNGELKLNISGITGNTSIDLVFNTNESLNVDLGHDTNHVPGSDMWDIYIGGSNLTNPPQASGSVKDNNFNFGSTNPMETQFSGDITNNMDGRNFDSGKFIVGSTGADTVYGSKYSDMLYGGDGSDTFKWTEDNFGANTTDRILDFGLDNSSKDYLDFTGLFGNKGALGSDLKLEFTSWDLNIAGEHSGSMDGLKVTINYNGEEQYVYLDNVNYETIQSITGNSGMSTQDALDYFYNTYIA